MSSSTRAVPAKTGTALAQDRSPGSGARTHRRPAVITTGITVGSFALFVDLLLVGHTVGGEVWGPVTAIAATVAGLLSLVCLARRGGSRAARTALYLLWATVAFLGVAGYHDHRPPRLTDPITDQRERPPYAPLAFAGIAMAGAFALRRGSEGA